MPDDADLNEDLEFVPEGGVVTVVEHGPPTVYHTDGEGPDAQIRLNVHSPRDKQWWRNVEMTGYFRWLNQIARGEPHWEMTVRGERHEDGTTAPLASVNDGVPPPPGTAVWPWWNALAGSQSIRAAALGSTYHANVYATTHNGPLGLFEKELSHVEGYADQRGDVAPSGLPPPRGEWFGYKFVCRNDVAGTRVKLELYVDELADGTWTKVSEYVDENGLGHDWTASADDGTDAAPYSIALNQLITWAGPWAGFRADNLSMDFRELSVREVDPF